MNPFYKFLGKEDHLQNMVINYIKLQHPNALVIHPFNEGRRTPFERFKFKFLGGVAGVPDVLIFTPNQNKNGLAIELKVGRNKPTKNQNQMMDALRSCKWSVHWSNDFDECKQIIDLYFFDNVLE